MVPPTVPSTPQPNASSYAAWQQFRQLQPQSYETQISNRYIGSETTMAQLAQSHPELHRQMLAAHMSPEALTTSRVNAQTTQLTAERDRAAAFALPRNQEMEQLERDLAAEQAAYQASPIRACPRNTPAACPVIPA